MIPTEKANQIINSMSGSYQEKVNNAKVAIDEVLNSHPGCMDYYNQVNEEIVRQIENK